MRIVMLLYSKLVSAMEKNENGVRPVNSNSFLATLGKPIDGFCPHCKPLCLTEFVSF